MKNDVKNTDVYPDIVERVGICLYSQNIAI